ncbi:MAG: hypothetical protein RLZZ176_569 [Cyanobacteriota bacterium]
MILLLSELFKFTHFLCSRYMGMRKNDDLVFLKGSLVGGVV